MDITAVICEYNPFHKGHLYQLSRIRELTPDTCVLCVMSPDFVQRGEPAVFDKFVRGECAVKSGADLVVSMPQVFALLSAEGFAEGGVRAAMKMGAVSLAFGVENDRLDDLSEIAKILISSEFELLLKEELKRSASLSFPVVRQRVLEKFIGKEKSELISTPNNILAVEYIKACMRYCPEMKLLPIKREGSGYLDESDTGDMLSASAIRKISEDGGNILPHLPETTHGVIKEAVSLDSSRYYDFLYSVLSVSSYDSVLSAFGKKELADAAVCEINRCPDYKSFREALSRKKFTETAINRAMCNILLGIKKDEFMHAEPEYTTLLAMNARGREILKSAEIPVISKFGNYKDIDGEQIDIEHKADRIWARCSSSPSGEKYFIDKKPFSGE